MKNEDLKTKEFEKYILDLVELYKPVLLLTHVRFTVSDKISKTDNWAEITNSYPYLDYCICYSERLFTDWLAGIDIDHVIVHEMAHVLTDPLYCKGFNRFVTASEIEDERERLTDHIANIIIQNAHINTTKMRRGTKKRKS